MVWTKDQEPDKLIGRVRWHAAQIISSRWFYGKVVKKNWLEIGISTGLVLLMILMLVVVNLSVPAEFESVGFVLIMLFFIIVMGFAGIKLADM